LQLAQVNRKDEQPCGMGILSMFFPLSFSFFVIPAKAGIQFFLFYVPPGPKSWFGEEQF